MKVPFIDYPKHFQGLKTEILEMLDDVLFERADLILRGDLKEFEENFAKFLGVKHAIGVGNCTDALHMTCYASGIKQGDEVITVAQTFVATVEAIVHCGASPVLVDISYDFNMNADLLEEAITDRTKAIIPVHLNGRSCDMDKIMSIADKHDLIVIEDAAQTLGGSFKGKNAGTFGLASCYSFFPAKMLGAAGDGGMIATNDDDLAEKLRLLRDHGRATKNDFAFYGFNSRLDNIQAALLDLKLKYFPGWIERRRCVASMYDKGLSGIEGLSLPPAPDGGDYRDVYQNYVIRSDRRDELFEYLRNNDVEVLISWPKPMHYNKPLGLNRFKLPVTEQISDEVISLPMNTEVTDEQINYVIATIREFYKSA